MVGSDSRVRDFITGTIGYPTLQIHRVDHALKNFEKIKINYLSAGIDERGWKIDYEIL